jgi:hypothetical protein
MRGGKGVNDNVSYVLARLTSSLSFLLIRLSLHPSLMPTDLLRICGMRRKRRRREMIHTRLSPSIVYLNTLLEEGRKKQRLFLFK